MKQRSAQFLRKRKFYLVLPLLALPFITLAFWAMGGGKVQSVETKTESGLNLNLPDAKLKDETKFDKLSFYNQAEKDSLKYEEALKNDPNYKPDTGMSVLQMIHQPSPMITSPYSNHGMDANEQKIYKKINELNAQINAPPIQKPVIKQDQSFSKEVDKLQDMMQVMTEKQADPEMQQINGVLDKILEIQHPEKKVKEKSIKDKQKVFAVQRSVFNNSISLLQGYDSGKKYKNGFFDLSNAFNESDNEHAIEAVVHETQTVVSGSTVKLRLLDDIYINGILIPKGNFVYGTASLESERLGVIINAVRYQNNILPVSLTVYDLDGIAGIHIPGAISRDVAKLSADQSLQSLDVTLDRSLAAQAANTGIQAAKSLLSKKAKLIKVTLKSGYKVLLTNKNN